MSRFFKFVCLALAIVSLPLALMMAGFAPALIGSPNLSAVQKLWGGSLVIVMMMLPLWILFFSWRTVKTWSSDSKVPAILAALPACLVIAFFAAINFVKFAP